jgi:hypothetical protein
MKAIPLYRRFNLEAVIWVAGLVFLAVNSPASDNHFSFCVFKNLGIGFCPGCGLGHSITHIFHLEFYKSFNAHPLGFAALAILIFRIVQLTREQVSINHNRISTN